MQSLQPVSGTLGLGGVSIILSESLCDEFEYCENHAKQYDDLIRGHPELAVSLADIPPATQDTVFPSILSENSENMLFRQFTTEVISQNSATTTLEDALDPARVSLSPLALCSSPSTPRASYQYKHRCLECGAGFDRATRARDHQFKDLGQTPHACSGRCGRSNW